VDTDQAVPTVSSGALASGNRQPARRAERHLRHLWQRALDLWFDARGGTETAKRVTLAELGYGPDQGVDYHPSGWLALRRMLGPGDVGAQDVFVDYGSGKGRVLLIAGQYPFKKIIGVEISEELNAIARANIERRRHQLGCKDIELVTRDAADYELPDDVTMAYFFNPFHRNTFTAVMDRICNSLTDHPRYFRIIYCTPVLHDCVVERGFSVIKSARRLIMYANVPDKHASFRHQYEVDSSRSG
jgi:Methyltransferase domain